MTPFQSRQLDSIRKERTQVRAWLAATGAVAEIGVRVNIPGTFMVNVMTGPAKQNFFNRPFESEKEAVVAFAKHHFGGGYLRKTDRGSYLVYQSKA